MALRLSARHVTVALVLLWLLALGATLLMLQDGHRMDPVHWAPAFLLSALLAAWPFALGWRPFTPVQKRLRTCDACGTQWRPADEGGALRCPACGS